MTTVGDMADRGRMGAPAFYAEVSRLVPGVDAEDFTRWAIARLVDGSPEPNERHEALLERIHRFHAAVNEEIDRREHNERIVRRRRERLAPFRSTLREADARRVEAGSLDGTKPVEILREWDDAYDQNPDHPLMLICGSVGVGKSMAAAEWAVSQPVAPTSIGWTSGRELLHLHSSNYQPNQERLEALLRLPVLVVDELMATTADIERSKEVVFRLIESRKSGCRTVMLTNMTRENLGRHLSKAIKSRLKQLAEIHEVIGADLRDGSVEQRAAS